MPRPQPNDDENYEPEILRKPPPSLAKVASIIRMATYGALLICIVFGGLLFRIALQDSRSYPETAAIAATFATNFIAFYIVARCVEKFLDSAERAKKG